MLKVAMDTTLSWTKLTSAKATNRASNLSTLPPSLTVDTCSYYETSTLYTLYTVLMIIILLLSCLGNCLVIMASFMSRQLRNRVTVYFIVSLACSDLAYALILIPFNMSMNFHQRDFCLNLASCYIYLYSDALCNVASILNLFLIAIDRFVAIKFPFRYQTMFSKFRAKLLILSVWIFSALWPVTGFFNWDRKTSDSSVFSVKLTKVCSIKNYHFFAVSFLGIYLVPLIIMTFTYLAILHVALGQIRAIEAHSTPSLNQVGRISSDNGSLNFSLSDQDRREAAQQRKRAKELKATKSVAIVYFAFLVCWFPNCVFNLILFFDNTYFFGLNRSNPNLVYFIYYGFMQILPMLNTAVNPFIYSFSNKIFRKAFVSVFRKLFHERHRHFSMKDSRRGTSNTTTDRISLPTSSASSNSVFALKESNITPY